MMIRRCLLGLLLVGAFGVAALGAPTFTDEGVEAGDLNPGDVRILVQTIEVDGDSSATLVNAITIQNLGTASSTHVTRIELTDGEGVIGFVNDPVGLNSAGITILTNYLVPRRETVHVYVFVSIAPAEAIPSGGRTLELRTRFHYEGMPADGWVEDGFGETIRKAGFERIDEGVLGDEYYNPGDDGVIHTATLFDSDANASPITIKRFVVRNLGSAVPTTDIRELVLWVSYNGLPRQVIPRPVWCVGANCWQEAGIVFDPVDFVVNDGSNMTIELEAFVADTPNNSRTLRTTIEIEITENGQAFTQISQAPSTQTILLAGLEEIDDRSTVPTSRVLTSGEVLTQTLRLRDLDANADDVEVVAVHVKNSGGATAQGTEIQEVIVRRRGVEIGRTALVDDFHTRFVRIALDAPFVIGDNDDDTITVHYVIGAAVPGHTLRPVVSVESVEPFRGGATYLNDDVVYPEKVSLYPAGLEIVVNVPPPDGPEGGFTYTGQRLLAQKIRCVDRDENNAAVTINPIVVENRGTAVGDADIVRVEIETEDGDLLGEATDLAGLEAGGITVTTLTNNVLADRPSGTERVLCVYVTIAPPEDATVGRTVRTKTTIFHVEDRVGYSRSVEGREFEIEINYRPEVDFTYDPEIGNIGQDVTFTPAVTDPDGDEIVSYEWDFGERGAELSTEMSPTHAYSAAGTFEVTLTATDAKGLAGIGTQSVTVNAPPEVDFEWDPEAPDLDQDVTFTATVDDPDDPADTPYTYAWDFDDETTSSQQSPTHAFAERRTYDVTLTVTDARGGVTTVTLPITVGNRPPEVDFTWTPSAPDVDEDVRFTATVTDPDDPDDTPYTYEWDFGDDETSTAAGPTHAYDERTTYTVTLTVTDSRRGRTTVEKTLSVGNEIPVASFTVSPTTADTGDEIAFTDTSTDADGTVEQWDWDFGDRITSTVQDPVHVYVLPGTYSVTLVVTDDRGGESNPARQEIVIGGEEQAIVFSVPNPAATAATITYFLPEGATGPILRIYDLAGRLVREAVLDEDGTTYEWDLRDGRGDRLLNGLYFCVVRATSATGRTIRSEVFRLLIVR